MCLVNSRIPHEQELKGEGYKIFILYNGRLMGECYSEYGPPRKVGKWLYSDTPGWHVFTTLEGIKNWLRSDEENGGILKSVRIVKVKYRGTYKVGRQSGGYGDALTASEILIPKNLATQHKYLLKKIKKMK